MRILFSSRLLKNERSFTLVEMLLVISILGILSTIVVVSVADSIEKARMVRSMNFASSIRRNLSTSERAGWSFNSTSSNTEVNDDSGNGNSVTLKGLASLSSDTPMRTIGGATSTDFSLRTLSESDYGDAGNKSAFRPGAITISFWFKVNSFTPANQAWMISNYEGPGGGYTVAVDTFGILEFRFFTAAGTQNVIQSPAYIIKTGKWYHAAVSYDGVSIAKIYLDSKKITEQAVGVPGQMYYSADSRPLNIGRCQAYGPHGFDGYIENLEIYNSVF
jgi:prepilin-type N-terminal cleavage/methylation domain-containing protein